MIDIGAGYGIVAEEALKAFPNARVTLMDYSAPMLEHARQRLSAYAGRTAFVTADLSTPAWTDGLVHRFDLAVSGLALHNLLAEGRHMQDLYKETFSVLRAGGAFLDYDLVSFTGGLDAHLQWLLDAGFGTATSPWNGGTPAVLVDDAEGLALPFVLREIEGRTALTRCTSPAAGSSPGTPRTREWSCSACGSP